MSARKLSVVVCTHKRPDGLAKLLETLVPQVAHHPDRELIVINDGTHDGDYADVVHRFADLVRYEALPNPVGIARARNRSAELASGDFLVFTDDDCEVPPHWLDWISATLVAHPELDVVAGTTKLSIGVQTGPLFGPYRRRIGTPLVRVDLDGATIRDERCS